MYVANAMLTAKILSSVPTSHDTVTGDPIFSETTITCACSLEENNNPNLIPLPGVDRTTIYLSGRCVSPKLLPSAFRSGEAIAISYDAPQGRLEGKFYLLPTIKSRLGLETVFGDAIAGWLVV